MYDAKRDKCYKDKGYKLIRIPYFVQLSAEVIEYYFNKKVVKFKQIYPHGFIKDNVILPVDFCEKGIERFKNEMQVFKQIPSNHFGKSNNVFDDIIASLQLKIVQKKGDFTKVLPEALYLP